MIALSLIFLILHFSNAIETLGQEEAVMVNKLLRVIRKDPIILESLTRNVDVKAPPHSNIQEEEESFNTYMLRAMAALGTIILTFLLSFPLISKLEWFLRDVVHLQHRMPRRVIDERINWLAKHHFFIDFSARPNQAPTPPKNTMNSFIGNNVSYTSISSSKDSVHLDLEEVRGLSEHEYRKPLGDYIKYNLLKIIYIFFATVLFFSGLLLSLWFIRVDFIVLIASLGIATFIAMIHLSDFIRNMAAYVWIIFSDIASLGDVVEFNGTGIVGVVVKFNIFSTTLRGFRNTRGNSPEVVDMYVPNNYFFLPYVIYRGFFIDDQIQRNNKL